MIKICNLKKEINGIDVLSLVSLEFDSGILGICGAKGSGKSTLLSILAGAASATSGNVTVGAIDVTLNSNEAKRKIGFMPEGAPIFADMTPYEFLSFIGEVKKIPEEKLYRQISELINLCELDLIKDTPIAALKTAQRRMVSFAQTLLGNPVAIILDEPFAGLSKKERAAMKSIIKMLGEMKSVIISSQDPEPLIGTCDTLALLADGELIMIDDPETLSLNKVNESSEDKAPEDQSVTNEEEEE